MFHLFTGRFHLSVMMLSLSYRILLSLEVQFPTTNLKGIDGPCPPRKHLRNLFWLGYIFDKEISLRTGQPPVIDDEQCDLTLPENYDDSQRRMEEGWIPEFPGDLRLSILKGKTSKLLYSMKALRKSDADLLRDIRQLDDDLEAWRLSIDPRIRPTLSCRSEIPSFGPEFTLSQSMHIMMTNFEYYYLTATIHRASGRCLSWAHSESGDMEGVSSSLALSVEASRSTLVYLRANVQYLSSDSFW
jgi:hypothetical protein